MSPFTPMGMRLAKTDPLVAKLIKLYSGVPVNLVLAVILQDKENGTQATIKKAFWFLDMLKDKLDKMTPYEQRLHKGRIILHLTGTSQMSHILETLNEVPKDEYLNDLKFVYKFDFGCTHPRCQAFNVTNACADYLRINHVVSVSDNI